MRWDSVLRVVGDTELLTNNELFDSEVLPFVSTSKHSELVPVDQEAK